MQLHLAGTKYQQSGDTYERTLAGFMRTVIDGAATLENNWRDGNERSTQLASSSNRDMNFDLQLMQTNIIRETYK